MKVERSEAATYNNLAPPPATLKPPRPASNQRSPGLARTSLRVESTVEGSPGSLYGGRGRSGAMHSPFSVSELIPPAALGKDAITAIVLHGAFCCLALGPPVELSPCIPYAADRVILGTDKGALVVFDLDPASTSTGELTWHV